MRHITVITFLFLLFNTPVAEPAVKTPEDATNLALEYLGFSEMEGFSAEKSFEKASIVEITDDKTPFLHDKINYRNIWQVTLRDIDLSSYKGYPDSVEYPRTFEVYIDPDDGTLLKIESIYAGSNIDFAPEPSIEWAEKQIKDSRYMFLGFVSPDSNYVSFNEILNNMGPRNFKQLKALLILNPGRLDDNPIAVWYVTYRGTHPFYPMGGKTKIGRKETYNYMSFIYDAKTGRCMSQTNQPSIEFDKLR